MTTRKLKYIPSTHAIERFREYFGTKEIHAVDFANDLMKSASFVVTQPDGRRLFKNEEYDTMVVIGAKDNTIITVLPSQDKRKEITQPSEDLPNVVTVVKPKVNGYNAIIEKARVVIGREIAKARKQFTTESRKLTLTEAEIGVEIAQLTLNKARAKNPLTQASIDAKINELENVRQAVFAELLTARDKFEQMRRDAEGYLQ